MRKNSVHCDDCDRSLEIGPYHTFFSNYFDKSIDLCLQCMEERISHSFSEIEDRRCFVCNGTGNYISYQKEHNQHTEMQCNKCQGRGVTLLVGV